MKRKMIIYALSIMSVAILLMSGCKKDNTITPTPTPTPIPATITDINGNVYHTLTIGTQVWLKENLKVTKYRNGDPIPNITDFTNWGNLTTGAYCSYNNSSSMANTYGLMYNWYAVIDSRKIAPAGWHVPTYDDVHKLSLYLGNVNNNPGGKLKETGFVHWENPNTGATNSTGFTALPGGRCDLTSFSFFGKEGNWWTSSQDVYSSDEGSMFTMSYFGDYFALLSFDKKYGISVRCIKD